MRKGSFLSAYRFYRLIPVLIFLLILTALPLTAQETPDTPEATPAAETTAEVPPTATDIATEAPTEPAPVATVEVSPETPVETPAEPVVEATIEATAEVTSEPVIEITPETVPTEATPAAPAPLPLAYSTGFDAGFPADLGAGTGWLSVAVENGQAVQSSDGADDTFYQVSTFSDTEVQAKILLNSGSVTLYARKSAAGEYAAVLSAAGTLTLLKNGEIVNTAAVSLTPGAWVTLKLSAVDGTLAAFIDNGLFINAEDAAPLPSGQAGFGAATGTLVRVDDFAIYGAADGVPEIALPQITGMSAEAPALPPVELMMFNAPSNLVPIGNSQIHISISWTDNSDEESTYFVAQDSGSGWVEANIFSSQSGSGGTMFFVATQLSCGQTIQFRVRAYRASNDTYTDYSPVLTASTTPCLPCPPAGQIAMASVSNTGQAIRSDSSLVWETPASVSGNGQYTVFMTDDNLTPQDTNTPDAVTDLYRYNRQTCAVELVTTRDSVLPATQNAISHTISGDGRYIAFETTAPVGAPYNLYVRDMETGTVEGITRIINRPVISGNGRYIVFTSELTSLVAGDTNGERDVFRYDRQTGTFAAVSLTPAGAFANDWSGDAYNIDISGDGRYIAFFSSASDIVSGASRGVFLRDMDTGTTTLVSVTNEGVPATGSLPSISSDGRYVAFMSDANSLTIHPNNGHVFVRDTVIGTTEMVSLIDITDENSLKCDEVLRILQ